MKEAKRNLEQLIEQIVANAKPTIVVTENDNQVVFVPLDEYNSWKKTLYLLASSTNAEHLQQSLAEARANDVQERELLEAFKVGEPARGGPKAVTSFLSAWWAKTC